MRARFFSAVLAAVLMGAVSVGITVSAEETATASDTTEPITETIASSSEETTSDVTETSTEMSVPTTTTIPDTDGNASLIKSERIVFDTEEMQLIAVTTKDGHVFYVLVDYADADSEDNVYFLNTVDDYDLYALLYADDEDSTITPEQALQAAEAARGNQAETSEPAETTAATEEVTETAAPKQFPLDFGSIAVVIGILILGGGAAAFYFFTKKKSGNKPAPDASLDEDEEDINFYDGDGE